MEEPVCQAQDPVLCEVPGSGPKPPISRRDGGFAKCVVGCVGTPQNVTHDGAALQAPGSLLAWVGQEPNPAILLQEKGARASPVKVAFAQVLGPQAASREQLRQARDAMFCQVPGLPGPTTPSSRQDGAVIGGCDGEPQLSIFGPVGAALQGSGAQLVWAGQVPKTVAPDPISLQEGRVGQDRAAPANGEHQKYVWGENKEPYCAFNAHEYEFLNLDPLKRQPGAGPPVCNSRRARRRRNRASRALRPMPVPEPSIPSPEGVPLPSPDPSLQSVELECSPFALTRTRLPTFVQRAGSS